MDAPQGRNSFPVVSRSALGVVGVRGVVVLVTNVPVPRAECAPHVDHTMSVMELLQALEHHSSVLGLTVGVFPQSLTKGT